MVRKPPGSMIVIFTLPLWTATPRNPRRRTSLPHKVCAPGRPDTCANRCYLDDVSGPALTEVGENGFGQDDYTKEIRLDLCGKSAGEVSYTELTLP